MVKDLEILIDLLKNYINNTCSTSKINDIDWEEFIKEANAHNCLPMLTQSLLDRREEIPTDVWNKMQYDSAYLGAIQYQKNNELMNVLKLFSDNDIRCCIFKGYVLAKLYPHPLLRMSGDVDILISPDDMEKAEKLLLSKGYVIDQSSSKENVPVYVLNELFVLELHSCLWEDYKGANIDLLNQYNVASNDYQIKYDVEGITCYTLGYTQHLIYLLYHMIKHFIPAGVGIRHFLDITVYVNQYHDKIDFNIVREVLEKMEYYYFVCSIFRVCINMLGMNEQVMKDFLKDNMPNNMTKVDYKVMEDVLDAGVFGTKTLYRRKATDVVKSTYYKGEGKRKSKLVTYINVIFPRPSQLSDRYVNAKKYPILLPVAWGQRVVYHISCKIKNPNEPSLFEKTKKVEERMDMLKELKLLN